MPALHEKVNNKIKEYFNITRPFPEIKLRCVEIRNMRANRFTRSFIRIISRLGFLIGFCPEQIVYLDDEQIAIKEIGSKININANTGQVIYKTGYTRQEHRGNPDRLPLYC